MVITKMQNAQKVKEVEVSRIKSMVQVAQGMIKSKTFTDLNETELRLFIASISAFGQSAVPVLVSLFYSLDPSRKIIENKPANGSRSEGQTNDKESGSSKDQVDDEKRIAVIEDALRNMANYGGHAELVRQVAEDILKDPRKAFCPDVHLAALRLLKGTANKRQQDLEADTDPISQYDPKKIFCCDPGTEHWQTYYKKKRKYEYFAELMGKNPIDFSCPSNCTESE